jgi:hypothetical protein
MFADAVPAGKVLASELLELLAEQSATFSKVPASLLTLSIAISPAVVATRAVCRI